MTEWYTLRNQVKQYEWGSPDWIPRLLGQPNQDKRPWAELWMGSHPAAPSTAVLPAGEIDLGELIARNPHGCLGRQTAETYGGLPFLFKLLAAERPLSIQAHPNLAQARGGFARENAAGLPLNAPNRNYKDPNHKPEIICALTPFTGMCGFRHPAEIRRLLAAFLQPEGTPAPAALRDGCAPLFSALQTDDVSAALRRFLAALFGLSEAARTALTGFIRGAAAGGGGANSAISPAQWELMSRFAELYPGDPALIAPLYLNVFTLAPGEAVFLRAGVLHAYIHGFGVELMASSDNVLRGGLTPKHVDVPELTQVLDCCPMQPDIIRPDNSARFRYPSPCGEFSLLALRGGDGETVFAENGPAICIVTEGELAIRGAGGGAVVQRGESVFIPPGKPAGSSLVFRGNYTLYAAMPNENPG